jgi:hypothetical protein
MLRKALIGASLVLGLLGAQAVLSDEGVVQSDGQGPSKSDACDIAKAVAPIPDGAKVTKVGSCGCSELKAGQWICTVEVHWST